MSDHAERIRLLTLCPPTWGRRDISKQFSVTEWVGRMAIELCESIGVLAIYENNQDRGKVSPLTIQTVLAYYEDDVISRCSSNTKDTINVKQNNGEKKPLCCRYMVMSLQEAFELFKVCS
ncbi:unnamed protein product [Rotaria socialis]|uniref:Uncharacterized protein n=1 Tax=Rotaria socialis TaxID=392032 RepID=A0A821IQ17_9BILA|nr:unnamed protein product [Rotaria socialis]